MIQKNTSVAVPRTNRANGTSAARTGGPMDRGEEGPKDRPTPRTLLGVALATLLAGFGGLACSAETTEETTDDGAIVEESSEAITGSIPAGTILIATSSLNLRASASTTARVLTTMPEGARVTAAGGASVNGFYKVTYRDQQGYAFGTFLDREGGTQPGTGTTRTVSLLWQGNWDFLTRCDRFSQGRVTFACQSFLHMPREFVDNDYWLAAPGSLQGSSNRLCGRRVEVCKGNVCRTATVVERSVESSSSKWEGSTRLIKDLGGDPGFSSCTSSWGTVNGVTLRY